MLELLNISHQPLRRASAEPHSAVLDAVHFTVPAGHLMAVLGATGSGKTTLLQLITAQQTVQSGAVLWKGLEVPVKGLHQSLMGWVPADDGGIQPMLNVKEHVVSSILLRVAGIGHRDAMHRADALLVHCGLDNLGGRRGSELDLPQKRRLALAMALVTQPSLVVCDDFAKGCGPKAERELGALLRETVKELPGRVVINATSSLAELGAYYSVLVLHEGRVCFHGPGRALTHYFSIPHTEDLYHRLAVRPSERWQNSWDRHSDSYYEAFKLTGGAADAAGLGSADDDDGRVSLSRKRESGVQATSTEVNEVPAQTLETPSLVDQLSVLMRRQWTMFRRQRQQWWWQVGFVVVVPLLMTLMGLSSANSARLAGADSATAAVGFSMLTLLQIGLLLAAAVWTTSRLVASARPAWRSEKVGGLGLGVRLASLGLFSLVMLLAQALVVVFSAELIVGPPTIGGAWRAVLLIGTSIAFGSLCLGTSACSANPDRAAARCWMLAFVNVLLSGAVLAWPKGLGLITQPLLTAAVAWAGSMGSLQTAALQGALEAVNGSRWMTPVAALSWLLLHTGLGILLMVIGARRNA